MLPKWQRHLKAAIHEHRSKRPGLQVGQISGGDVQRRWLATPVDITKGADRDVSDPREKVVILGSGWAGNVPTLAF